MRKRINRKEMLGQRFGRVVVTDVSTARYVAIQCDCGKRQVARIDHLREGRVRSCGCLRTEAITTHGMSDTPTYKSWEAMKGRCLNPNDDRFKDYGGRGITVCEQWQTFENFFADMGERPDGTTLDRKDNSLGYALDNCRWATPIEQQNNMRSNHVVTIDGETKTIAEMARDKGINRSTLAKRISRKGGALCQLL